MHHLLHASSDRAKPSQPQPVERCSSQRGDSTSPIAAEAVRVLVELGVADPVPALNAPTVPHYLQQCFWGGAQSGEEQMGGVKGFTVATGGGRDFHDPVGADPGLADVLRRLFGP